MPAHLTSSQIARLVDELYDRARRGWPPELRHWQLADDLGCHPEVQAAAWDLWQTELELTGQDVGGADAWLSYSFYDAMPVD